MRPLSTLTFLLPLAGCPTADTDTGDDTGVDTDTGSADTDSETDTDTDTDTDTGGDTTPVEDDDTIYDVQSGVIRLGEAVTVENVLVTGIAEQGFWVCEPRGGRFGGVWVASGAGGAPDGLAVGDAVTVHALVDVVDGRTQLRSGGPSVLLTGKGVGAPNIKVVPTSELADPVGADAWEGVLVRVEGVTVGLPDSEGGWTIDDGVVVGKRMTTFSGGFLAGGATFESITGVYALDQDAYQLQPRTAADFQGFEEVDIPPVSIYDLRAGTIALGDAVHLEGVRVTASRDGVLYVQEVAGGEHSGTLTWGGALPTGVAIGDEVEVWGYYTEAFGLRYVSTGEGLVRVTNPGAGALDPEWLPVETLGGVGNEAWNMVLVGVEDVVVELHDDGAGNWLLEGGLAVAQDGYRFTEGAVDPGTTFEKLSGIYRIFGGAPAVRPRQASDYVGYVGTPAIGADLLSPGDLVVTEIMADPSVGGTCDDRECEWIEIYNASGVDIDLERLRLETRRGSGSVTSSGYVGGSTPVPAGSYVVLAASSGGGAGWTYPFSPNAAWTGLSVSNSTDVRIVLSNRDGELDRTALYDSSLGPGVGAQLSSAAALSAVANDDPGNWCAATWEIGSTGDYGTPGSSNDGC